ncbi:hypothetical protein [Streptomyces gobitricini]|uniref:Uncharacterized protein n=1 Tax=Streptomyces gobitricini TaxID=68211 RepID=A0ABN3M7U2_9ACTN
MRPADGIPSPGVAVTLVVHEHKPLRRGSQLAAPAEELGADDAVQES